MGERYSVFKNVKVGISGILLAAGLTGITAEASNEDSTFKLENPIKGAQIAAQKSGQFKEANNSHSYFSNFPMNKERQFFTERYIANDIFMPREVGFNYIDVKYGGGDYIFLKGEREDDAFLYDMKNKELKAEIFTSLWLDIRGDLVFSASPRTTQIHVDNVRTDKSYTIPVPAKAISSFHELLGVSDSGRFVSWYDDAAYVYDNTTKKVVKLNKFNDIGSLKGQFSTWDGETLYYFGHTKSEMKQRPNIKVLQDPALFSYNAVTGEHKRLVEGNILHEGFSVKNGWLVYEDFGVHVLNIQTGEKKTIHSRESTKGSYNPVVYNPTINKNHVYYTLKNEIMRYDLKTGK